MLPNNSFLITIYFGKLQNIDMQLEVTFVKENVNRALLHLQYQKLHFSFKSIILSFDTNSFIVLCLTTELYRSCDRSGHIEALHCFTSY